MPVTYLPGWAERPFGAKLHIPPLAYKRLPHTLPQTHNTFFDSGGVLQDASSYSLSMPRINEEDYIISRCCNPLIIILPRLVKTSPFKIIIGVQQRAKCIPQSSLSRMPRKSRTFYLIKEKVTLNIVPIKTPPSICSVVPSPHIPYLVRPVAMSNFRQTSEYDSVLVIDSFAQLLENLLN